MCDREYLVYLMPSSFPRNLRLFYSISCTASLHPFVCLRRSKTTIHLRQTIRVIRQVWWCELYSVQLMFTGAASFSVDWWCVAPLSSSSPRPSCRRKKTSRISSAAKRIAKTTTIVMTIPRDRYLSKVLAPRILGCETGGFMLLGDVIVRMFTSVPSARRQTRIGMGKAW